MSEQSGVILESDPAVVMDMRLGQELDPGQVIDVNYDLLRLTLGSVGAPLDNNQLSIVFAPENNNDMGGHRGEYDTDCTEITVAVKPHALDVTQDTLEHEMQHYADDRAGHFDTELWLYTKLYHASAAAHQHKGKLDLMTAVPPISLGLISLNAESSGAEQLLPIAFGISISAMITLGRSVLSEIYRNDPSEVRAHKAEKSITLPPTVTIA